MLSVGDRRTMLRVIRGVIGTLVRLSPTHDMLLCACVRQPAGRADGARAARHQCCTHARVAMVDTGRACGA